MISQLIPLQLVRGLSTVGLCCVLGCAAEPPAAEVDLLPVGGTVTRDGKPLPRTIVTYLPLQEDGTRARGVTDLQGHYQLVHESEAPGAAPGEYKIVLQIMDLRRVATAGDEAGEVPMRSDRNGDPDATPLRAAVRPDATTFNFDLTDGDGA